jgi:hypothetical protein
MPVLAFVIDLLSGIALTAWVIRRDMRKLTPERYARGWNVASFWSAVVGFGPLSIWVHFVRTRRSFAGALLGFVWATLVLVATSLFSALPAALGSVISP